MYAPLGLSPSWRVELDTAQCCGRRFLPACDPAFCSIVTLDAGKEPEAEGYGRVWVHPVFACSCEAVRMYFCVSESRGCIRESLCDSSSKGLCVCVTGCVFTKGQVAVEPHSPGFQL